jgi:hypothetical protein
VRGTSLAKDEVYGEYLTFCQADGKDPMLPSMFGKMVHRAFPGLKSSRTGAKGKVKSPTSLPQEALFADSPLMV